ncbi:hypothetical protein LJC20_05470 [Eubacteriales bacterium OttesenSCG-928-M02]|nr:hypothetical protein [Eubacteriales bacterium OttesenSCG-928-M02]
MDRVVRFLQQKIDPLLANKAYASDDELYLYLILNLATIFCGLFHILLFVLFLASGIFFFVILNSISIGIYLFCLFLIRKGQYQLAGLVISLEVTVYTLVSSYFIGEGTYIIFYYVLVLMMQAIIPYGPASLRVSMGAVLWGCLLLCTFHPMFLSAKISLGGAAHRSCGVQP